VEEGGAPGQRLIADGAVSQVGQPAEQAGHPEGEVGHRHPDGPLPGMGQHGEDEAEDDLLRVMIGQGLFEHLGVKGQGGSAGVVHGVRERRGDDLAGVEAHQFLPGLLYIAGEHVRHGFKGAPEAAARLGAGLGDALDLAGFAREERHDQIGLMQGPGLENDRLDAVRGHNPEHRRNAGRANTGLCGANDAQAARQLWHRARAGLL